MRLLATRDKSNNVFVVHLSQGGSFLREGFLLWVAHLRGFATIAHLHGSRFVSFAERHPKLVSGVLRAATKVIVLSEATREAVSRFVQESRVHLVPNAVPQGNVTDKERVVVFGGAVSYRKGVDVLLAAWQNLAAAGDWRLQLAGPLVDPELRRDYGPSVEFLGAIPHERLMSLLDRSAIAVLPSRDEAMPMFILEAMARKNCVVSTRVGGIPAVLGDGHGIVVEPGDQEELCSMLGAVMRDDKLRERIAEAGYAAFELTYSARVVYPRVESLWQEALNSKCSEG
jgi:glycosyltransferase involved in cell wall biosynthesis